MSRGTIGQAGGQPSSTEEIYYSIRHRILNMDLEPGQKISENLMTEEYQVSRSVIHSVFVRLSEIGLLTVYPQRGTFVTKIDLRYIEDLLVLRTAVEKEALYELMTRLSRSEKQSLIQKLEDNLKRQEDYREDREYVRNFQKLDSEFHREIIESVGRYRLVKILEAPMLHVARWRNLEVLLDNGVSSLVDQHRQILEMIKNDDLLAAQEAMARHLDQIAGARGPAMEAHPQYFE